MSPPASDSPVQSGLAPGSVPSPAATLDQLRAALAGRYEIAEELGRGGAAYVLRARDLQRQQDVALKILRPELAAAVTQIRFLREIEMVRKLEHPNVLPLLDSGSADGQLFFTMPLVTARTLRHRLDESGALPMAQVIAISRDIASALDYAHSRGVIHRDIKPSNTLLDGDRAFVADFGIARAVMVASGDKLTDSGASIGTPEYMSPEQATGARQLDSRCDVYSLACVVYEMLSGAPPFTGPTSQAIIARQCHEAPPPLHVVRPTISQAMERVVGRALAKVPADRYATAGEFVEALEAAVNAPPRTLHRPLRRVAFAAAVLAAIIGAWWIVRPGNVDLDPSRIVVFPLSASGLDADEPRGEAVATYVGYALEGTRPLRWLEGWQLLDAKARSDTGRLTTAAARALSRKAHAGYFIDGAIIRSADSVTVALQLSSVSEDSVVARSTVTEARTAFIPNLGLRAVARLMSALLQPGRTVDVSALSDRQPASVVNFLQGEHEYRRMQFTPALAHYKASVRMDSTFALAALRGAQSADWLSRADEDSALVEIALSHEVSLPLLQRMIARGLRAYVIGNADSAVYYFERALALEPASAQTWAMLGEVYARMLPTRGPADSLSEQAFQRARSLDAGFAPALLHLERLALRRGDRAAIKRLAAELKSANADTSHSVARALMTQCLEHGPASVDWSGAVRRDIESVLTAGKLFSAGAMQPACARAALQALLEGDSIVPRGYRWVSLLTLEGIDEALGRSTTVGQAPRRGTADIPLWPLAALRAGPELQRDGRRALDSLASSYGTLRTGSLWYLGLIALRLRDTPALTSIQRVIASRADSSGTRVDRLVASQTSALLKVLRGDSAAAIRELRVLRPTARRNDITWQPWESLAAERLLLAELLLARGDARSAIDVATLIDAPEPVAHLYYLRRSLQLRVRAADLLRDAARAKSYRARLAQLDGSATRLADSRTHSLIQ